MNHEPVDYRPEGASRHETPASVCDTCSDFDGNPIRLVPVSFCPEALAKAEEEFAWIHGDGPRPDWMDSPDAARWTPALVDRNRG